jgi:adenylate kinase family enzyme
MKCIILSGLSGSGKTTLGKYYCGQHREYEFIDGDDFYLENKPKITLKNGMIASNWDTEAAIDWNRLNKVINEKLKSTNIILATFLPLIIKYTFHVDKLIRLDMGPNELELCIQARIKSKNINDEDRRIKDRLMVTEIVYPIYLENIFTINHIIKVYNKSQRKLEDLSSELNIIISSINK